MTNVQLRAELFREINPLLDNESAIREVLVFLRNFKDPNSSGKAVGEEPVKVSLENIEIPAQLRRKRGCIQLTKEDLQDERIQYILNK